jgi:uncharacterized protein YdaU (DUF1376 family)
MTGLYKFDAYPKDWYMDTRDVSPAARGIYCDLLLSMYTHGGPISADERYLCRLTGCQWRTLRKLLAELIDTGKIKPVDGHLVNGRTCREIEKTQAKIAGKPGKTASKTVQNAFTNASETPTIEQNQPHDVCPSPSPSVEEERSSLRSQRAHEDEAAFDLWYQEFPHKVGKGAARRAFPAALKKAGVGTLIAGIHRYKATKPTDQKFCNPATWLNQERWLDEPAQGVAAHGQRFDPHASIIEGFGSIGR